MCKKIKMIAQELLTEHIIGEKNLKKIKVTAQELLTEGIRGVQNLACVFLPNVTFRSRH